MYICREREKKKCLERKYQRKLQNQIYNDKSNYRNDIPEKEDWNDNILTITKDDILTKEIDVTMTKKYINTCKNDLKKKQENRKL